MTKKDDETFFDEFKKNIFINASKELDVPVEVLEMKFCKEWSLSEHMLSRKNE